MICWHTVFFNVTISCIPRSTLSNGVIAAIISLRSSPSTLIQIILTNKYKNNFSKWKFTLYIETATNTSIFFLWRRRPQNKRLHKLIFSSKVLGKFGNHFNHLLSISQICSIGLMSGLFGGQTIIRNSNTNFSDIVKRFSYFVCSAIRYPLPSNNITLKYFLIRYVHHLVIVKC